MEPGRYTLHCVWRCRLGGGVGTGGGREELTLWGYAAAALWLLVGQLYLGRGRGAQRASSTVCARPLGSQPAQGPTLPHIGHRGTGRHGRVGGWGEDVLGRECRVAERFGCQERGQGQQR